MSTKAKPKLHAKWVHVPDGDFWDLYVGGTSAGYVWRIYNNLVYPPRSTGKFRAYVGDLESPLKSLPRARRWVIDKVLEQHNSIVEALRNMEKS